jgi:hypothetical protein
MSTDPKPAVYYVTFIAKFAEPGVGALERGAGNTLNVVARDVAEAQEGAILWIHDQAAIRRLTPAGTSFTSVQRGLDIHRVVNL